MENRTLYGVMTLLFSCYGVPCFMQGMKNEGLRRILFGILSIGVIMCINAVYGIINGIKILKMTDEEFAAADKTAFLKGIPAIK